MSVNTIPTYLYAQTHIFLIHTSQCTIHTAVHFSNVGTPHWLKVKRSLCHVFVYTHFHLVCHVIVECSVCPFSPSLVLALMPDFQNLSDLNLVWWQWTKPLCHRSLEWNVWLLCQSDAKHRLWRAVVRRPVRSGERARDGRRLALFVTVSGTSPMERFFTEGWIQDNVCVRGATKCAKMIPTWQCPEHVLVYEECVKDVRLGSLPAQSEAHSFFCFARDHRNQGAWVQTDLRDLKHRLGVVHASVSEFARISQNVLWRTARLVCPWKEQ